MTLWQPDRRAALQSLGLLGASLFIGGRSARAQAQGAGIFWVNVQASGGWDQALFCDPKPNLRGPYLDRDLYLYNVPIRDAQGQAARGTAIVRNPSASAVRSTPGGGISYLGFADFQWDPQDADHPYQPFFPTLYDRITVFNGVDTATNNHSVGERYSAGGSLNEGMPCFAAQMAGALGADRPLSFINLGGYDETAGLLAATPLRDSLLPNLLAAAGPNDIAGDNQGTDRLLPESALAAVRAAQSQRRARLVDRLRLPTHQTALATVEAAGPGLTQLGRLRFRANDQTPENLLRVGLIASREGLAVSMNVISGGFDSHQDNEQQQIEALYRIFELLKFLIAESEAPADGSAPVPVVALVSSDFGRTPHRTEGGTDHWPPSSAMVVQNR
ncbi:MAG: DUF1501 domain-containing protein, partial [Myxococcales bacterium]|nr:DUF1501 domain-containing protein [Myxococcales bacterium]